MTSVVQLLSEISKEVGAVKKDQKNQAQKFNFRGIDQVVNATHAALTSHGVVATPRVIDKDTREITSGGGKRQAWVLLTVEYTFRGPDGDSVEAVVASEATDFADKATAKAMSVAYRTALLQVLHLPTDDPDPDSEYVERGASPAGELASLIRSKNLDMDAVKAQWAFVGGDGPISQSADEKAVGAMRKWVDQQ
ncbi:putative ERF-like protein [uncultured Caudovirales phage]|uniref:Putative ERF-like protein n=1 Tax=uncultured Caudovirales phage TaxID=2100421 RepID=A0A2H4JAX5_9CAUD|nr:putative ERF-like protein [uncultured Caudovirales phage]